MRPASEAPSGFHIRSTVALSGAAVEERISSDPLLQAPSLSVVRRSPRAVWSVWSARAGARAGFAGRGAVGLTGDPRAAGSAGFAGSVAAPDSDTGVGRDGRVHAGVAEFSGARVHARGPVASAVSDRACIRGFRRLLRKASSEVR